MPTTQRQELAVFQDEEGVNNCGRAGLTFCKLARPPSGGGGRDRDGGSLFLSRCDSLLRVAARLLPATVGCHAVAAC